MSTEIINKKHTRVDEVIEFEVKDNLVAFSIECSSERSNTLNFMIYTDCDEIQGQHFSRVESTKIFIGFERANTSLYSLPLKKSSKYYITDFNTSDYMKNNFAETDMVIKLFYDKDLYQEYFSANFVNLDESEELIHFMKESSDDIELTEYDEEKIYQDEERWYVGDLHTHTIFSDGNLRREENIRDAKSQGLDFFFATDHNILPLNWPKSEEILVVPAEEITTEFGHFNLYFAKRNPLEKENIMKISDKE